jgi:tetratricopeptide (TPR) repeat protein
MTFDKQKVMRSAERYLMQGKIRAAIDEYVVIVQQDSKDVNTLNMLGDLYARVDEKAEAVKCFTNVAEHYDKQGFSKKAIAIYNKISRLIPDSVTVSEKLAPLYHQKGSLAEARTHYKILADDYQKRGKKIEALNILKKIADLDPYNTEICLKLADSYLQENYKEEAMSAFIEAGNRFIAKRNYESAVTVFNRALEINALDWVALNGYVSSQISLGNSIEAAERLEELHTENPYNTDIMLLLADCYIDQNNLTNAERVLIELVAKEPANYFKLIDLVYANLMINDLDSAVRVLNVVAEHLLVGGKNEEYKKIVDEFLTRDAEHTGALRLLVRYYAWLQDAAQIKVTLERLASSARVNDLIEDEKYALSQLVTISPHETQYSQRLAEIGGVMQFETETSNKGIFAETEEFQNNGVPTFANFEKLSSDDDSSAEFENNGFAFAEEPQTEFLSENYTNENFTFASSNDYLESEAIHQTSDGNDYDFSGSISSFEDAIFSAEETSIDDSVSSNVENEAEVDSLSSFLQTHLNQELESVEFYISSGYYDLAKESLDSLERQFGVRSEIKLLREKIITHFATENIDEENSTETFQSIETQEFSKVENNQETISKEVSETEFSQELVSSEAEETEFVQEIYSDEITEVSPFIEETVENESVGFEFSPVNFESNIEDFENDDSVEVENYLDENLQNKVETENIDFEFSNAVSEEKVEVSAETEVAEVQENTVKTFDATEKFAEFGSVETTDFDAESLENSQALQSEVLAETEAITENSSEENYEVQEPTEEKVETHFEAETSQVEETQAFAETEAFSESEEFSEDVDIHKTQDATESDEIEQLAVTEESPTVEEKVESEKFEEESVETKSVEKFEEFLDDLKSEENFLDKAVDNVVEKFADENVNNAPTLTGFEGFDDFRNSLGLEEAEAEDYLADYETHFNLGIAYKEMGLNDDAVKEFQDAVKLVKSNDGTRRHLQSCHFLGHCFMEKSMPKLALIWFEKGLETTDLNAEEKQALFYEIACAYEMDGERESAFRFFEQIYAVDVEYRDVANKIKELA